MAANVDELRSRSRFPRSLTKKGLKSRESLLSSARRAFEESGFYATSVAEISRRTGMSQGAFYQYFKNKEQIFLELNDRILGRFWSRANRLELERLAPEASLRCLLDLLYRHCRENHFYHRILGEFELIDAVTIGYFDSIARFCRSFVRSAINAGRLKFLDPNVVSYGLIGMAVFHAMNWGPEAEGEIAGEQLNGLSVRMVRSGIDGGKPASGEPDPVPPVRREPPRAGVGKPPGQRQATAGALLDAAEQVFGRYGYHRAGITEITRAAGVAQGTFYVHFKSKRDLLESFVRHLSRQVRRELKVATQHISDRREVERIGIASFFRFLARHRSIYRVVTESETMGQATALWYYRKLAAGYQTGLAEGMRRGEIRNDLPVGFMVRSIMGMVHMVGLKWLVWNSKPSAEMPPQLVEDLLTMILEGLKPR
jgi:AcrR family transcriptional regulator